MTDNPFQSGSLLPVNQNISNVSHFKEKFPKIVFCWNNCSGYSQEKCFKCNLVFPKLSRLKKGQRVKVF